MRLVDYRRKNREEVVADIPVERPGDLIAGITETPEELEIDMREGLRGARGRRPVPADFDGLLTPEGNSGDVVGSDISEDVWDLNSPP